MELDRQECMELLAAKAVGRLAYVVDNGARILPFNYVVAEDSVILRTVHGRRGLPPCAQLYLCVRGR